VQNRELAKEMATNIEAVGTKVEAAPARADRLPLPRIVGYGIGDFGFNFYWFSLQLFLAYYYTDVLGLRSEVAGLVIFLCLTWDGLIDPAIGVLASRTRTRWGKYRPYLLLGSVPLAVSFALMFAPVGLEGAALIGYAFATQVLFRTMYALVNIPYGALMATMTLDSMQRNWLAGARMICAFLGTAVVSYFTPRLVTYFTSGGRTTGYFGATAVLAAIATVFTIATFAATREDSSITQAKEQPPPLSELLRMLAKNVPFLQIIAGIGCFSFANMLVTAGLVYYVKYYLGENEAIAGQAASLLQITITAMILPWTIAARYIGKRWAWQAGLAIAFAGLLGLYFSGARDANALYGYIVVYAIGSASIGVNFWSIVPDTVEYGEWRTGVRAEAFVFGFVTLIQKIALGVSSAFLGAYLGWAGYVANEPQSPQTAQAIKLMITLVAAGGLIASALVMHFYRLDARTHARLVQEIAARKLGRESV
jgi:glycoside/pentoside/hexuronide:cation symporter, GPH family